MALRAPNRSLFEPARLVRTLIHRSPGSAEMRGRQPGEREPSAGGRRSTANSPVVTGENVPIGTLDRFLQREPRRRALASRWERTQGVQMAVNQKLSEYLDSTDKPWQPLSHPETLSSVDEARALGIDPDEVAKSLVKPARATHLLSSRAAIGSTCTRCATRPVTRPSASRPRMIWSATSPITSWEPRRRLPAFSTCAASWIRRSDRGSGSCSPPVPTPTRHA